jgi:hypothetical protein
MKCSRRGFSPLSSRRLFPSILPPPQPAKATIGCRYARSLPKGRHFVKCPKQLPQIIGPEFEVRFEPELVAFIAGFYPEMRFPALKKVAAHPLKRAGHIGGKMKIAQPVEFQVGKFEDHRPCFFHQQAIRLKFQYISLLSPHARRKPCQGQDNGKRHGAISVFVVTMAMGARNPGRK